VESAGLRGLGSTRCRRSILRTVRSSTGTSALGGWVIETRVGKIFFSGDTGYAPLFAEICKRLGPMRLSFIPSAVQPRWFMKAMHVDPPEAVRIHQDVGSNSPWACTATFKLTMSHCPSRRSISTRR